MHSLISESYFCKPHTRQKTATQRNTLQEKDIIQFPQDGGVVLCCLLSKYYFRKVEQKQNFKFLESTLDSKFELAQRRANLDA